MPSTSRQQIGGLTCLAAAGVADALCRWLQALTVLGKKANGDVRSSLNTLQMLSQRFGEVTVSHVSDAALGQKDMSAAPFEVWSQLLFQSSSKQDAPANWHNYLAAFGESDLVRCFACPCLNARPSSRLSI